MCGSVSSFWEHGAGPATICSAILFHFLAASDTDLVVLKVQRRAVCGSDWRASEASEGNVRF